MYGIENWREHYCSYCYQTINDSCVLIIKFRAKLLRYRCQESTTKDATVKNQVASRSIVSASKPIFSVLRTASAWTVRTLKEVKREELC